MTENFLSGLKSASVYAYEKRKAGLRNPIYGFAWSDVGWVEFTKLNKFSLLNRKKPSDSTRAGKSCPY
jgi:hypothetical protein